MQSIVHRAQWPKKLECLFTPKRYKVLYGGRGGTKSWGIARALLKKGTEEKLLILCVREIQNSIKDSVHKLLSDQIELLGLQTLYEITDKAIRCKKTGTEFIFKGLKLNATEIKSTEGVDICWVEEANKVSKDSWKFLIPTIRKPGSEIWISFNPELDTDETYKRFVLDPPSESVVVKINWRDNPWLSEELRMEKDDLRVKDYDEYLHVWEGNCKQMLDGAVYAKELRKATADGRIRTVPHEPTVQVHTFWDLGWSDSVAIWFAQATGMEYRILRYMEVRQTKIADILQEMQTFNYNYGTDFLPHDAAHKTLAANGRSIEKLMQSLGRKVVVVDRDPTIAAGIDIARTVFDNCYFDENNCADGLNCLRRYHFEKDDHGQWKKTPVHDQYSHGADAFRILAKSLSVKRAAKPLDMTKKPAAVKLRTLGAQARSAGWMK